MFYDQSLERSSSMLFKGEHCDIRQFLLDNNELIQRSLDESARTAGTSVKSYVTMETQLVRESEDGLQSTETKFQSDIHFDNEFDVTRVADEISHQLDHFNREGSSWRFEKILSAKLTTAVYRPLAG